MVPSKKNSMAAQKTACFTFSVNPNDKKLHKSSLPNTFSSYCTYYIQNGNMRCAS